MKISIDSGHSMKEEPNDTLCSKEHEVLEDGTQKSKKMTKKDYE